MRKQGTSVETDWRFINDMQSIPILTLTRHFIPSAA